MKKTLLIALLTLFCVTLASCGAANAADTVTTQPTGEGNDSSDRKQVYGEVYEVIGNMITLKLIEIPEGGILDRVQNFQTPTNEDGSTKSRDEMMQQFQGSANFQMPTNEDGSTMSREEMMQQFQQNGGARINRDGNGGEGEGENGTPGGGRYFVNGETPTDEDGQPVTFARPETKYTGEQLDLVIPVGIPVMEQSYSTDGVTESEVAIESIKTGSRLLVTYAADGVTIEKAVLMGSNGGGMRSFNFGEGDQMPAGAFPIEGDMVFAGDAAAFVMN